MHCQLRLAGQGHRGGEYEHFTFLWIANDHLKSREAKGASYGLGSCWLSGLPLGFFSGAPKFGLRRQLHLSLPEQLACLFRSFETPTVEIPSSDSARCWQHFGQAFSLAGIFLETEELSAELKVEASNREKQQHEDPPTI
jgi:hypothetical protein